MLMSNFARFYFAPDAESGVAVDDEPVPETVEPEPEVAEPEPEPDPHSELFSTLDAFGIGRDHQSAASTLRQLRAQADEAQQLRAMLWQMKQQPQQQQQPAPDKPKRPWDVPQFDRKMLRLLTKDEQGRIVPVPGADPTLAQKYQEWEDAREAALDHFLGDPYGALQGGFAPFVQQEAARVVQAILGQHQQQFAQHNVQQRLGQFTQANKEWLYDKITGQITPMGKLWDAEFRKACQYGHPDPFEAADRYVDAELARYEWSQQQEKPAPAAQPGKERIAFLKGRQAQNRGNSLQRPNGKKSPVQDPDAVFERLRKEFDAIHQEDPNAFIKD